MRTTECSGATVFLVCLVLVCVVGMNGTAAAAAPAAAPRTIWNFLGIPQGVQKVRDAATNRRGNFPGMERKPALKPISDPSNLEAGEPEVIKKAAEIKIAEDKAPQKIKAIKYLAEVGCGCYEGVADALLAALEDCTEEVRYEAAKAFSEAAGDPCETCGGTGCCNAKTMTKLYEMAHAQDESGCYVEQSSRVREAAKKALEACQQLFPAAPSTPTPAPRPPELGGDDSTLPPQPDAGLTPFEPEESDSETQPKQLNEEGLEDGAPMPPPTSSSGIANPITLTGMMQVDEVEFSHRQTRRYPPGPPAPGMSRKGYRPGGNHLYRQPTTTHRRTGSRLSRPAPSKPVKR